MHVCLRNAFTGCCTNLAKLGDGLDESPTDMVGDNNNNFVKIGAY